MFLKAYTAYTFIINLNRLCVCSSLLVCACVHPYSYVRLFIPTRMCFSYKCIWDEDGGHLFIPYIPYIPYIPQVWQTHLNTS